MTMRHTLVLAAAVLTGCLTIGAFLARPAAAEPKAAEAPTVGRYQIVHTDSEDVVVIDTVTAECWRGPNKYSGEWKTMGSPVKAK